MFIKQSGHQSLEKGQCVGKTKEAKEHAEYAVGTFIQEGIKLVGHTPIERSFLVFTFLRTHEDNQVVVEVTGSRKLENGLVIPVSLTFKAVT